jgi:hypothetical protein
MKKYLNWVLVTAFCVIVFLQSCREEKAPTYDQLLEEHNENEFSIGGAIAIAVLFLIGYWISNYSSTKSSSKKETTSWDDDDEWDHPTV